MDKLNLKYILLIFDEALYSKAQQIRWKSEEFLSKFIIRLGDFHTCMSFASAIACRFREAGLQVLRVNQSLQSLVSTTVKTVLSDLTQYMTSTIKDSRSHATHSGVICDIQNIWSTL